MIRHFPFSLAKLANKVDITYGLRTFNFIFISI